MGKHMPSWEEGARLGKEAEDRFFTICTVYKEKGELSRGMMEVKRATTEQDHNGIDAVVITDIGEFFLQIKRSRTKRWKHNQRVRKYNRPETEFIAVPPDFSDQRIFQRFELLYWNWRDKQEAKRKTAPG